MLKERKILVVGHKNPDTDSICSAIAYAEFKNRTGSGVYEPRRAGEINAETKYVLDRFGVPVPEYLGDVGAQVCDMEIRRTPGIAKETTVQKAWDVMDQAEAVTQPVTEDGKVIGLITKGDIAQTLMYSNDKHFLSGAKPHYRDIAETIGGRVVIGDPEARFTEGKVLVGAAATERMQEAIEPHDLVILVDRPGNQLAALDKGADCLILCLGVRADADVVAKAYAQGAVIIETDLDTYSVSVAINKSVPLESFMLTDNIMTFKTDDFTDKVRAVMAETRHRAFPVVDDEDNYIGTVSRRNLLGIHKKELILVDHNEQSQAVDNIDQAEVLEIIDHHRIGTLQTLQPIYFVNQPVGCTATILYQMFVDRSIEIRPVTAGLMCAAIISDTLMFRSPTCTTRDKMAAGALALIADINIEDFATEMFEAGSDLADRSAEDVFYQDYKKFTFGGKSFGVGQISSMSADELAVIKDRMLPLLENECGKNGVSMVFFLLTNIRQSSSEIIFAGDNAEDLITMSFKEAVPTDGGYRIDGLLSRKKQLIPAFMRGISMI
ncbi:MAG: putative manganese-dependent inorganic diphosphatase [Mogibacterium sp.]|nr:putative manganese-dependent inorganic diphosphatase [Mogibacterium sp.]